jgi:sugar O-acyltransferase (sialic acid O-acetyltransferase NeuD family)
VTTCIVVGAGAQGRVTLEAWRAARPEVTFVLLDDDARLHGTTILGASVVGGLDRLGDHHYLQSEVVLAIGNNQARLAVAERLQTSMPAAPRWAVVVHPSAVVMPSATLGGGTVVLAGAVVNTEARIGAHVVVNTGVIVEHDCVIEDGASLSPGTRMGGRTSVGRGAFVSTGVTLAPRVRVGDGAIVGAGAVVVRDVPERVMAYGNPARVIRAVDASFDWKRVL